MRLLSATEKDVGISWDIKTFSHEKLPCYAILSHTWGADETELTYQDVINDEPPSHNPYNGYRKLEFCKQRIEEDGLKYVWIDTCCINKAHSSELLEALNSMFRWYQGATRCYVYLDDVTINHTSANDGWKVAFRNSRWFTRGWTLQELLAPSRVEFYARDGTYLGDKRSLEKDICEITGIPSSALQGVPLSRFGPETRMSWLKTRCTGKPEDRAYCIAGLFNVFLPFLYGVGEDRAMTKLWQEIRQLKSDTGQLSERFIRVGGASWSDLTALDARTLEKLDVELEAYARKEIFRTAGKYAYHTADAASQGMRELLEKFGVMYFDEPELAPSRFTKIASGSRAGIQLGNDGAAFSWPESTWRMSRELYKGGDGGDKRLAKANIAARTLRDILVWRGIWKRDYPAQFL